MHYIEIQTMEGKRLEWVAIAADSDKNRLMNWGNRLKDANPDLPVNIRLTDGFQGDVVVSWQDEEGK